MQGPILITGGTGSFGKTMINALLENATEEIRVFSRDEEKQDALRNELQDRRVRFYIGDVRDRDSVDRATKGVRSVFHAAALKQVPSCEFFPIEALRTNVQGSENVIRSCINHGVKNLVCLSTDKAVFPINAMGMTKALMEKCARAASQELGPESETTISCVRYGNVMYSRGSVLPLFIRQIRNGLPITLTDPHMTRFLMPLQHSVALVKHAFEHARQGDLFIRKSGSASLQILVDALKDLFNTPDHPVEAIGWRHGEKLYETLASSQELAKSEDMGDYYRIQMDDRSLNYKLYFSQGSEDTAAQDDYHSHNARQLDVAETRELLLTLPEMQAELKLWKATKS